MLFRALDTDLLCFYGIIVLVFSVLWFVSLLFFFILVSYVNLSWLLSSFECM